MDRCSLSASSPETRSDADEASFPLERRRNSSQTVSKRGSRVVPGGLDSSSSTEGMSEATHCGGSVEASTGSSSPNGVSRSDKLISVPREPDTPISKKLSKRPLWPSGIRWSQTEVGFYIALTVCLHCYSLYRSGEVSQNSDVPLKGVVPSTLFSSLFEDDSDPQWHIIRGSFPLLLILGAVHITCGNFISAYFTGLNRRSYWSLSSAERPLDQRVPSSQSGYQGVPLHPEESAFSLKGNLQDERLYDVPGLENLESSQPDLKQLQIDIQTTDESHLGSLASRSDYFTRRTRARHIYECLFGLCFIFGLHQFGALFLLFLVTVNYFVVSFCLAPSRYHAWDRVKSQVLLPIFSWGYCIALLFTNDIFDGYRFSSISHHLSWMDSYRGFYSWTNPFNFIILRIISYNFDYLWAIYGIGVTPRSGNALRAGNTAGSRSGDAAGSPSGNSGTSRAGNSLKVRSDDEPVGSSQSREGNWSRDACHVCHAFGTCLSKTNMPDAHRDPRHYLSRQQHHCPLEAYGFLQYFSYLFFTPLYLAGPICSFNAWSHQIAKPQKKFTVKEISLYGLNCLKFFLMNLIFTHGVFSTAILTKNQNMWGGYSLLTLWFLSMSSLLHIWLKLTFIWRLFRFWSLAAGVDTPENMLRCLFNNISIASFWKSWHSSFNQWLLRYMYFPLGGGHVPVYRKALNIVLVFTFVALWHDINLKLLSWSWLICLGFIPEIAAGSYFSQPQFNSLKSQSLWRYMVTIGIAIQNFTLAVANLIGFAFGLRGAQTILSTKSTGDIFIAIIFGLFFMYVPANVSLWRDSKIDEVVSPEEAATRPAVELSDIQVEEQRN